MLSLCLALLCQVEPLDKALETATKDAKPVLCLFHWDTWGKDLERPLLEVAEALDPKHQPIFAHADWKDGEPDKVLQQRYKLEWESTILLIDPQDTEPLARIEPEREKIESMEPIIKRITDGFDLWGTRLSCRKIVQDYFDVVRERDRKAFDALLWKPAVDAAGSKKVDEYWDIHSRDIELVTRWEFRTVDIRDPSENRKRNKFDDTVKADIIVWIWQHCEKDGEKREGAGAFNVIQTDKGFFLRLEF